MLEIGEIRHEVIGEFIEVERTLVVLPDYLESLLDYKGNIRTLLTNKAFAQSRKAYGIWFDGDLRGYAIVYIPEMHLDCLYIAESAQGMGYGEQLVRYTQAKKVVVHKENEAAISLYEKIGLVIEFDDE